MNVSNIALLVEDIWKQVQSLNQILDSFNTNKDYFVSQGYPINTQPGTLTSITQVG